ncbi:MAG: cysteine--tRNA ligase [Patescibacteria group bacterium]
MKIYNTLTKKKEEFKPQKDMQVKMYVCGPTVYDHAHLGNLRTYINTDLLRRWLKYSGYEVEEVMNITDIDDKTIKRSIDEKVPIKNVTQKYEKMFLDDLKKLNIEIPEKMPHATGDEVIDQMIMIVQKLLDDGYAYKSDDGSVYYSVKKFKGYGKLSGIDLSGIKEGARVAQDEYEKENAQDFVLWKAHKDGEPSWDAPFGKGRPGWHIECSAMSTKYLGDTLDIHAGGVDLIFPHHENEIAQSESFTGKRFVNYWFHCEHLMMEGKKMSKSLGNIYTLDEMCQKYKVKPHAFRLLALMSHYREPLNFTKESILQSKYTLLDLRTFCFENSKTTNNDFPLERLLKLKKSLIESLNDDLNTSFFFAKLQMFIKEINTKKSYSKNIYDFLLDIDKILAIGLDNFIDIREKTTTTSSSSSTSTTTTTLPYIKSIADINHYMERKNDEEKVDFLFDEYMEAKNRKDYDLSDKIRGLLFDHGWIAEDYYGAYRLRRK